MASSATFKAGLFEIGLNIEKKLGNHYLFIESKLLTHYLEIEPIYIKPAIRNLQAVLLFNMDATRKQARLMLEELVSEDENDLNALADLIYVYKNMGRERDSQKYKELLRSHKDDRLSQARSLLGQANALTYDLPDDHNKTPAALLKDTWRLLNMKDNHLKQVIKANVSVVEAYKVVTTIPETAHEKKIKAKRIAVEKFEKGIEILEDLKRSKEEIFVWKHNLAIARSRMDTWKNRRGDGTESRSKNCIKVLEAHLDVIENLSPAEHLEEPLKKYVARSNIFFAQLYKARKHSIDSVCVTERIKRQNLDSMRENAMSICPNDQIVLQRYARFYSNNNEYENAIEIYNKSIKIIPDIYMNWFSYASRRDAYYYYSLKLIKQKSDRDKINEYLVHAYNDGKLCLQSKCTEFCMMKMTQICFERAMPNYELYSFHCVHKDFIYEALENIHEMLKKRDITKDCRIYYELGKCYPYIDEYRKAVESLKTSLELGKWSLDSVFSELCTCFVVFYERDGNEILLSEFRFMLKEAKKNGCEKWVTDAMVKMSQHKPEILTHLVENMIKNDVKSCKKLIEEVLEMSFNQNQQESARICQDLTKQFETKLQEGNDGERNDEESDINREIQELQSTENFQYDFYVSHSENDSEWVYHMLRPQLEEVDEEIKFKGFIPERDSVPGDSEINSMIKGIQQSCKLLILLTPNYLEDKWQKFVSDQMILSVIETKVKEKTIIPIILEECDIPNKLKTFFPAISFTEISDWERLRMSLTLNMDSEATIEEGMSVLTTCDIEEDKGASRVDSGN